MSTSKTTKKIIIIGSGFCGLASGALLAKQGYSVTILEKNEQVGGRASVFKEKGFTFDMGPSWYLMPDVFEKFFSLFNAKPSDFYSLKRLDPSYRIFFGQNDIVDIASTIESNIALFKTLEEDGDKRLQKYLTASQKQYESSMEGFVYRSYDDIFDPSFLKALPSAMFMNFFESIGKYATHFFNSEKARKILQYNIVFLGGSTKNTPALYAIMAHIDFNLGVWYPQGGFGEIVKALQQLCERYGVDIRCNQNVKKILVTDGIAKGVRTETGDLYSDIVLSNADYHFTETQLLDKEYQTYPESYWEKKTIAPSGFIAYLGLNKKIPQLSHHNLFLDNDWEQHFDEIFNNPKWPENPSYYISCPSKTDSTVAPEGCENVFILVPVAAGLQDNPKIREDYFEKTLTHLEKLLDTNLRESIVFKKLFAHNDFSTRYNAYKGTALGLSHTLFQSAWFRPRHTSKKVKNLFYAGGYTHPGIGVPMQFITAQIITKIIASKL